MTHYDYREYGRIERPLPMLEIQKAINTKHVRNIFNQAIEKQLKELNMTIDKNRIEIDKSEIQVGDLIRAERDDRSILATEWRVGINWTAPNEPPNVRYFLLDRPKKIKWAKGTTLWLKERYDGLAKGAEIIVSTDHHEGDSLVNYAPGRSVFPHRLTDIKPYPHPRGSERWVAEDHFAAFGKRYVRGQRVTIHCNKVYADGASVCVDVLGNLLPANLLSSVEIKPEPHPVGATRWVTEDHTSPHGYLFSKGDRVTVFTHDHSRSTPNYDIEVKAGAEGWDGGPLRYYTKRKFLSATPVEPEPVFVSVRKDALDKLRADTDVAGWAVSDFLKTVDE